MQPFVSYLGHLINAQGLHPLPDKVRAVQKAPPPKSVAELKSYLGLLTYYSKFSLIFPPLSLPCTDCCIIPHIGVGSAKSRMHSKPPRSSLFLLLSWFTSTWTWKSFWHVMPHHMASGLYFLTEWQMVQRGQSVMPLVLLHVLRLNRSTVRSRRRTYPVCSQYRSSMPTSMGTTSL